VKFRSGRQGAGGYHPCRSSFAETVGHADAMGFSCGRPGTLLDITLATLLFLLGAILFVYLSYTVISRF
jgi:hypothetical protein